MPSQAPQPGGSGARSSSTSSDKAARHLFSVAVLDADGAPLRLLLVLTVLGACAGLPLGGTCTVLGASCGFVMGVLLTGVLTVAATLLSTGSQDH